MDVIKSFKVKLNLGYGSYLEKLNGAALDYNEILDKFAKDLTNESLEEIIRFFNLEEEDYKDLTKDNFAIGYKITKDNRKDCVLEVNVRIDIRVPDPDEGKNTFDLGNIMGMMGAAATNSADNVVDSEGEVIMENDNNNEKPEDSNTSEESKG